MNIKRIISESINNYINNIILEDSEFNYVDSSDNDIKNELANYIKTNNLSFKLGKGDLEFDTDNYHFDIDYVTNSNINYSYDKSNDYDIQDSYTINDEDDWHFDELNIHASNDSSYIRVDVDDKLSNYIKNNSTLDYDSNKMPSNEELFNDSLNDI